MELKVNETGLPQPITFNYEELKTAIAEKAEQYTNIVYTDETIKEAKADRASLNKLKKTLNDERIRREREYMKPFKEFKDQINEIIAIIDKPVQLIDSQIKDYQERQREDKRKQVEEIIANTDIPEGINTGALWDSKWLNASTSLKQVGSEIAQKIEQIESDLETIDKLDRFSYEARAKYCESLDLRAAIEFANKLTEIDNKRIEREAREKAQPEPEKVTVQSENMVEIPMAQATCENSSETKSEPQGKWITFRACLTVEQAKELKAFCTEHGIELKAVTGR